MIVRSLCAAAVLWLSAAAAVSADDATPPPVSTPAPVSTEVAPTPPPVATDIPATAPAVTEPTNLSVAPERSTPVASVDNPGAAVPTARPETRPAGPRQVPVQPQPSFRTGAIIPGSSASAPAPSPGAPPDLTLPSSSPDTSSGLDLTPQPTAAQAPAQLTCSPRRHQVAAPFMSSPYAGWTELVSYVDHDQPDYAIDGKIVIANGLTALASDGQASDLFPAYWSPGLRQYVNYDGHNGYDFDISYQPVLATAAGTVQFAGWNDPNPYVGYGQMVLIDHHNGYVTLYGHLSKLDVSTGDKVTAGQEIGISGTTGHSSGPHLHFSVFHDCQVADPYGWTGKGKDPLETFAGSRSSYLWLPGQDPLLLNPPPNCPSYPLGLHLSFASGTRPRPHSLPPADRLLLLALPSAAGASSVDSGTALARTEAAVTSEAEELAPQLEQLKLQGLVSAYQVIPNAAAVWVDGTASSAQLEALPGVASLSGIQPHDVRAAEAGLAHATLAQIGREQAPSLWPVGFRSGLHAWRPVATVLSGQALVAGLALPGRHVVVSLQRGSSIPAAADVTADPATGGFVALLLDSAGKPVGVEPGDRIQVACAQRTTEIAVRPAALAARSNLVGGESAPGATVAVSVVPAHAPIQSWVMAADAHGRFSAAPVRGLAAGTQVVAGLKDAAGNEQATSGFVPGLALVEGSNIVRGWTVGSAPHLLVLRSGHTVVDTALHPAPDGSFALALGGATRPTALAGGDVIVIGSPRHHRSITLPNLTLDVRAHGSVRLHGVPRGSARISLTAAGETWLRSVRPDASGSATATFPVRSIRPGDRVSAEVLTAPGDSVTAITQPVSLVLHEGTPEIAGVTGPGQVITLQLQRSGRVRGMTVAIGDPVSGRFQVVMRDTAGRPLRVGEGNHLLIGTNGAFRLRTFPRLRIKIRQHAAAATIMAEPALSLVVGIDGSRGWQYRVVRTDRSGRANVALTSSPGPVRTLTVSWRGDPELSVQRTLAVGRRR